MIMLLCHIQWLQDDRSPCQAKYLCNDDKEADAGKKQGEVDLLPLTHLFRKQFG